MTEYERTVLIKIKDHDPLNVSATRLTSDSGVFTRLIYNLGLTEIEIEDFEPDIVILFLTLLEDKKLDEIEDSQFRELHKISTVFKVYWLVEECRTWLCLKIRRLPLPPNYNLLFFLFEECLFIVKKWDVKRPMNLLVSKLVTSDNGDFITRYVKDLSDMKTIQLDYLLKLAGTDSSIFVDIINKDLENKQSLTDNQRYLMKNINFRQIRNKQKYGDLFERIANLPNITKDDLRLALQSLATFSKIEDPTRCNIITVLDDTKSTLRLPRNFLEAILWSLVAPGKINIFALFNVILATISPDSSNISQKSISEQRYDAELLVNWIVNIAQGKIVKQVSAQYIDMIIALLKISLGLNKYYLIEILEKIRENETLSTYSAVHLKVSDTSMGTINWWTDSRATFRCSASSIKNVVPECDFQGDFGFLITKSISDQLPPVDYARCFLAWTIIYTFNALTSVDGAHSALEYARGFMPTRSFLIDLLKTPVLTAAANVFSMKMEERNTPSTIKWELVKDESMYRNTEIHCHDYFSAADVELYTTKLATLDDEKQVLLPSSLYWTDDFVDTVWKRWLPNIKETKHRNLCAHYFIHRFLVAKQTAEMTNLSDNLD